MKTSILKFVLCLIATCLYQAPFCQPPFLLPDAKTKDFFTLQSETNAYYLENPKASGYKLWKRAEWYMQSRVTPDGKMINLLEHNAKEWWKYTQQHPASRSTNGSWLSLGPTSIAGGGSGLGRLNTIRIHPTDTSIIYVGASNGGIWKSVTGGTSWINISPYLPTLSVTDILIDPVNPSRIFVLTGDSYGLFGGHGIGVIQSLDGGLTWMSIYGSPIVEHPHKLIMHPTNPDIQFLISDEGVHKTENAWANYNQIYVGQAYDLEFKPDDPDILYLGGNGIYKKVGTDPFQLISDSDFSDWPSNKYVSIGVTPDHNDCVYAFVSSNTDPVGLYRSLSAGENNTWTIQDEVMFNFGSQGFYNRTLQVHPENYEQVTIGQVWTKVSTEGGIPGSWQGPVNYVHADAHNSLFTTNAIFHVNDGGIFKSTDGGIQFTDLSSGLGIMEMYGIAGTPQDINLFYCGVQDNGTNRRTTGSQFHNVMGNDGGNCLIDYSNEDIVYATYQNGFLQKSTNGGQSFDSINPPGNGAWISPLIMDPIDPEIIFTGKATLYRSDEGGEAGSWINLQKPTGISLITQLAQGTNNRNVLYLSNGLFAGNKIHKTTNALIPTGNPGYVDITHNLPNGNITGIAVNPDNSDHVYVTYGATLSGIKVFRSLNGGGPGSWENISGALPNVAVNCIEFHDNGLNNNALYIGTDIGVFYTDDDLEDWIYFSNNLPITVVTDLYINMNANVIAAGTYGRGLWLSDTYDACEASLVLTNPPGNPIGGIRYYSSSNTIVSTAEYRQDLGTETHYTAGGYIDMKPGFRIGELAFFNAAIGPCPGPYAPPGFQAPASSAINFDYETWIHLNSGKIK